ncbi:ribonuclease T2 [Sporobolomyces salmoneus]|uniref:ribonuclease T2 n=1 Tax=Sporobolomyces salmoneus TaxID=183962 RepID=UPI00316EDC05
MLLEWSLRLATPFTIAFLHIQCSKTAAGIENFSLARLISQEISAQAHASKKNWPDNCDGSYEQYCDQRRQYTDIRGKLQKYARAGLVDYMDVYWKDYQGDDESFWEHEWGKHGTCISTLNTTCYGASYTPYEDLVDYFERTVDLFTSLPTYSWLSAAGIIPSTTKTYTLAQLQAVAKENFGYEAVWNCQNGALNEVWWGYVSKGPIAGGQLIPTSPIGSGSTCPDTGIQYLPKNSTSTGGGSSGGGSTGTKSFLNVLVDGTKNGCLISNGKWYTTGTCAGYEITPSSDDSSSFTLTTSKGSCSVTSAGEISCADGNTAAVFSKDSNNYLTYSSSSDFYAPQVATGSNQVIVSTNEAAVALKISIQ